MILYDYITTEILNFLCIVRLDMIDEPLSHHISLKNEVTKTFIPVDPSNTKDPEIYQQKQTNLAISKFHKIFINIFNGDFLLNDDQMIELFDKFLFILQTAKMSFTFGSLNFYIIFFIRLFQNSNNHLLQMKIIDILTFIISEYSDILDFQNFPNSCFSELIENLIQNIEEYSKPAIIYFLSSLLKIENQTFIELFLKNDLITFFLNEFESFVDDKYDQQDPEILSMMSQIIDSLLFLITLSAFLSDDQKKSLFAFYHFIFQNFKKSYFYNLFIDAALHNLSVSVSENYHFIFQFKLFSRIMDFLNETQSSSQINNCIEFFISLFTLSNEEVIFNIQQLDIANIINILNHTNSNFFHEFFLFEKVNELFKILIRKKPGLGDFLVQNQFFEWQIPLISGLSFNCQLSFWFLYLSTIELCEITTILPLLEKEEIVNNFMEFFSDSCFEFSGQFNWNAILSKSSINNTFFYSSFVENLLNSTFSNEIEVVIPKA
ncbi:hypothetical protein TRFO_21989 [Tritrichomonas foetus]|uniref:Uncharacterized protein n=1 Tax=Tritrichomonas foetus TaxID=1144522 RepID=A0A1J4KIU6_9EUKA|nr:hypothetical protein TRFO_21989 [Tritrichomonas foetus]|eukprot:OHT09237.1 hypothetical protein TRFO_21989 [Tritrichomonas foetus]